MTKLVVTIYHNQIIYIYRIRILPRVLRDVSKRDISTTVLGEKVSMPLGVAPTGMHKGAHPEGECATAKGYKQIYMSSLLKDFNHNFF